MIKNATIDKIIIYADGACIPNPGTGGWAAIIITDTGEREISDSEGNTTNNRMELMGIIRGLQMVRNPSSISICSDSQYVTNAFNKKWIYRWKANNWMVKQGKQRKNFDLWEKLLNLTQPHNIQWVWVRGHSGDIYNERCDKLAFSAITKKNKKTS